MTAGSIPLRIITVELTALIRKPSLFVGGRWAERE